MRDDFVVPESQEQGKVGDPSFGVIQHHVVFESPSVAQLRSWPYGARGSASPQEKQ